MGKMITLIRITCAAIGVIAISALAPAQAISIQEFDTEIPSIQTASLMLSLSIEEFRYAESKLGLKARCIDDNFLKSTRNGGYGSFGALIDRMREAKNKDAEVEDYVLRTIEAFCATETRVLPFIPKVPTFSISEFYEMIPDNIDKVMVLNFAISTQAMRIKKAGNEPRAQCVDRMEVKVSTEGRPVIPPAFKQDVMQKLATLLNDNPSNDNSVENIVIKAITKNCGGE